MARLRLLLYPDGRGLLTTEDALSHEMVLVLREQLREWMDHKATAVLMETEVVRVVDFESQGGELVEIPA